MNGGTRDFLRAGHLPTLVAALAYFDVSFMAWVLLGPLAPFLTDRFGLTPAEQGLLTAVPLLGGSIGRPLLGALGDRLGGRRAGLAGLALTLVPLVIGWRLVTAAWQLYAIGLLLGVAGASFAVALPLASRWYPREYQGLVMGIAGAGNSGTLLATLVAPRLAERYGWANAFGAAILPVGLVAVLFAILAKDAPVPRPPRSARRYRTVLAERDALWLAAFYGVTFGGFVGLASFLTVYFHEQYGLSRVAAGDFATVVVIAGSLLRPLGGWLSDRIGGYRLLAGTLAGVALCLAAVAATPRVGVALALLFAGMGLLGMGNGAVFQVVPVRFPQHVGLVTGVVGAAGGLGGFFLPTMLGAAKELTGSYGAGLAMAAVVVAAGLGILLELGRCWQRDWPSASARLSGVFAYRRTLPRPAAIVRSLGD